MAEPQRRNRAYDSIPSFFIDADLHFMIVRFRMKTDLAIFEFFTEAEGKKSVKVNCDGGMLEYYPPNDHVALSGNSCMGDDIRLRSRNRRGLRQQYTRPNGTGYVAEDHRF